MIAIFLMELQLELIEFYRYLSRQFLRILDEFEFESYTELFRYLFREYAHVAEIAVRRLHRDTDGDPSRRGLRPHGVYVYHVLPFH